jgi:hypothetical protein
MALSSGKTEIFTHPGWQMSFGERAALEGLLVQLKPHLSIEIGTGEGGSLSRIAAHSGFVHAFDFVQPPEPVKALQNVQFHTGDSHLLLPHLLDELNRDGRAVDFVLVDGDHSEEGVLQDMNDLLRSPAVSNAIIVMHDTMNDVVRSGLERVSYRQFSKVVYVDLDFVPGYLVRQAPFAGQLWGGLGVIVVDTNRERPPSGDTVRQQRFYSSFELFRCARDILAVSEKPKDGAT